MGEFAGWVLWKDGSGEPHRDAEGCPVLFQVYAEGQKLRGYMDTLEPITQERYDKLLKEAKR